MFKKVDEFYRQTENIGEKLYFVYSMSKDRSNGFLEAISSTKKEAIAHSKTVPNGQVDLCIWNSNTEDYEFIEVVYG